MEDLSQEFKQIVDAAEPRLLEISEAESQARPAGGNWSAKEILGHLIDSASNNHRRFVEAQLKDDLVFPGYDQERWVTLQRYQETPWPTLVKLWKGYNMHLAHVVSVIPQDTLTVKRRQHTLDKIAWRTVSADEPVTLEYLVRDYLGHLQDHLSQILVQRIGPTLNHERTS